MILVLGTWNLESVEGGHIGGGGRHPGHPVRRSTWRYRAVVQVMREMLFRDRPTDSYVSRNIAAVDVSLMRLEAATGGGKEYAHMVVKAESGTM